MDRRELDQIMLELLPPDGRATLEEAVDEFVAEEALSDDPARMRAAAGMFSEKGCDRALPVDKQLVAHQMAAALRMRASAMVN